jgi:hypothetical protein
MKNIIIYLMKKNNIMKKIIVCCILSLCVTLLSAQTKNTNKDNVQALQQRIIVLQDSIHYLRSTIDYKAYINVRRIEKVKYYISICKKHPKNKKYFFGWVQRTVSN